MSGGGGGVIIIKSKVRQLAELDVVKDVLSSSQRQRHDAILAKPDADWSQHETHVLVRHSSIAFDSHCESEGC